MIKPSPNLQVVLSFRQQLARTEATESYQVEVIRAPGRGWGGPFSPLGLDESHTLALRQLYSAYLARVQTLGETLDERAVEALRVAGSQLFQAFPETVQARLHHTQALARDQGRGVDLILAFKANARPLLALPWELLHDPETRTFWALSGNTLTRQLWLSTAPALAPDFRPQQMIGVWAAPEDGSSLALRARYTPAPNTEDTFPWLIGADSLGQLSRALESGRFDGLHLVAHGQAGSGWRDFSLALADEKNCRQWIRPDQLAGFLAGYPRLRFVYLDVCGAGGGQAVEDMQPGGLATSLLGMGISAVVAMQDTVAQEAAGQLAQTFYAELAHGQTLAGAVATARRAVRVGLDDPLHWSVPALYSQQKWEEPVSTPARFADRVLDQVTEILRPELFVGLTALLLAGALARVFVALELAHFSNWRELGAWMAVSFLFLLLGAGSMRAGQRALGEDFQLDWRGWVGVLMQKYIGAGIIGYGWWAGMLLAWLVGSWLGVGEMFGPAVLQVVGGLGLAGLTAAGYAGARQSIRHSRLFMRLDRRRKVEQDVFLFFAMPLFPVFLAWIVGWLGNAYWNTWGGWVWGLVLCVALAFSVYQMAKEREDERGVRDE